MKRIIGIIIIVILFIQLYFTINTSESFYDNVVNGANADANADQKINLTVYKGSNLYKLLKDFFLRKNGNGNGNVENDKDCPVYLPRNLVHSLCVGCNV